MNYPRVGVPGGKYGGETQERKEQQQKKKGGGGREGAQNEKTNVMPVLQILLLRLPVQG